MFLVPWRQISDPKFGGLSRTSALNRSTSVDSNNFANTSRNLGNGAREDVANYYSLIGSRMRAFDWYQIVTLNGVLVVILRYLTKIVGFGNQLRQNV